MTNVTAAMIMSSTPNPIIAVSRAKQKKLQREEERKRHQGKVRVIENAKALEDGIKFCEPSRVFHLKDGVSIQLKYYLGISLPSALADWMFEIVKANTKLDCDQYVVKGEWHDIKKRDDLFEIRNRFILAFETTASAPPDCSIAASWKPVGFIIFQYQLKFSCDSPVVYCHEIHCVPEVQLKGLGTHLMTTVEQIGRSLHFEAIMLTNYCSNVPSSQFFTKLKYTILSLPLLRTSGIQCFMKELVRDGHQLVA